MMAKQSFFKMLVLVLVCSMTIQTSFAQKSKKGIQFFEGSWEEALALAEKEGKPIFLDGYASWCGPCKKMINEVFPQKAVGDFYNDNYIALKVDMEKGEGPMLKEKFGIRGYPTFVYANSKGEPLHVGMGYMPAEDFIGYGKDALDADKQIYTLQSRYEAGENSTDLISSLTDAAIKANQPGLAKKATDKYLSGLKKKQLKSKPVRNLIMKSAIFGGKGFDLMLGKQKKFGKLFGASKVQDMIVNVFSNRAFKAIMAGDKTKFGNVLAAFDKHVPSRAEQSKGGLNMMFHQQNGNWMEYAKTAASYIPKFKNDDWSALNGAAWTFYEQVDDKPMLEQALGWATRSVELDKNFYNTDTQAALLFKLGRHKEALRSAKTAVGLAKKADMDASETEGLIEKIKAAMGE